MGNQYIGIRPRCIRKPALLPSGQKQANIKSAGLSSKFFGSDSTSKGKMLDQIRSAPDRKQKCPVVRPFRHHRHRKRGGMPAKAESTDCLCKTAFLFYLYEPVSVHRYRTRLQSKEFRSEKKSIAGPKGKTCPKENIPSNCVAAV